MNNKYDLENHEFIQEVDETDLNCDVSYKNKSKKYVILLIILAILSLLVVIIAFAFYINGFGKKEINKKVGIEDLFVVHSKTDFGDTIKSFANYNSLANAYTYTFYVENNTDYDIYYYVNFDDIDFGIASNLCDKSKLNFNLIKNGVSVSNGLMNNEEMFKLLKTNIASKTKDDYILKLWSESGCNGYMKYKINVID